MQLLEHYRRLAGYDGWANQEVIRSLRDMADPPARSVRWVAHILAAEYVWLSRLHSEVSPLPVWPELSLPQCHEQAKKLLAGWTGYLDPSPNLGAVTHKKNGRGGPWANPGPDTPTHLSIHSASHRG